MIQPSAAVLQFCIQCASACSASPCDWGVYCSSQSLLSVRSDTGLVSNEHRSFTYLFGSTFTGRCKLSLSYLDWMLFRWKVIAWKSWCLPALDRKVCWALQRCHGGALWHVSQPPCLLTPLSEGGRLHLSGRRLVDSYLPWTGWDFFFFIRWNDFQ